MRTLTIPFLCFVAFIAFTSSVPIDDSSQSILIDTSVADRAPRHPEGAVCDQHKQNCAKGLKCACLVLSRGLHTCQSSAALGSAAWEAKHERGGLKCTAPKAVGADAMAERPPMLATGGSIIGTNDARLKKWAQSKNGGNGFYTQYMNVYLGKDAKRGLAILAPSDVAPAAVKALHSALSNFIRAFREPKRVMKALAKHGGPYRYLLKGSKPWTSHPEISKHFATGPGGASEQFPSIGCAATDEVADKIEEFFHTVQYTMFRPRDICLYHRAYEASTKKGQYRPEFLETLGEPVPTTQADEYLAAAMRLWFGWSGAEEYSLTARVGLGDVVKIRKAIAKEDPNAFCLLNNFFDPSNTWPTPVQTAAVDLSALLNGLDCPRRLRRLGATCPQQGLSFWS